MWTDRGPGTDDATASLIVTTTLDGEIVAFNRAAESFTGVRSAGAIGRRVEEFISTPPGSPAAGRSPSRSAENHWRSAAGELRLIRWRTELLMDGSGRPQLVVATGTDITDG